MKHICLNIFARYRASTDGVVTLEWVGIAAVVVIAAILISGFILESADGFAGSVVGNLDAAAESIAPTP